MGYIDLDTVKPWLKGFVEEFVVQKGFPTPAIIQAGGMQQELVKIPGPFRPSYAYGSSSDVYLAVVMDELGKPSTPAMRTPLIYYPKLLAEDLGLVGYVHPVMPYCPRYSRIPGTSLPGLNMPLRMVGGTLLNPVQVNVIPSMWTPDVVHYYWSYWDSTLSGILYPVDPFSGGFGSTQLQAWMEFKVFLFRVTDLDLFLDSISALEACIGMTVADYDRGHIMEMKKSLKAILR